MTRLHLRDPFQKQVEKIFMLLLKRSQSKPMVRLLSKKDQPSLVGTVSGA